MTATTQPKWMRERLVHIKLLRERGYCTHLLAHMKDKDVKAAYEREQAK